MGRSSNHPSFDASRHRDRLLNQAFVQADAHFSDQDVLDNFTFLGSRTIEEGLQVFELAASRPVADPLRDG